MDNKMNQDIRWKQRFLNYKKALTQLENGVVLSANRPLSKLEQQGLIQSFEYTHELAWKVIKDYFYYQGNSEINGSRDAIREAFKFELISDGEGWMGMIKSRNLTSHTYNEDVADEISSEIVESYYPLFMDFKDIMQKLFDEKEDFF